MEYAQIDEMINKLWLGMREETLWAAFLTNNYDIATHQLVNLGPVSDELTAEAVKHTTKAARIAKRLRNVCTQYLDKYGDIDRMYSILNEIQEVCERSKEASKWLVQYKAKSQQSL